MDFEEAFRWLYSFDKFGSHLGLERITALLERLGNPHHDYHIVHVTGTNGKGSVCQFLGSILTHAGYNVGVYLSPHLQRFSERILLKGQEISEDDIASLVTEVKPVVDDMIREGQSPTFFEIVTAMAFLFFSRKKIEYAVVEVGLGGRLDATNVVTPMVSVITNISLEHADVLGDSVKLIAKEKAGIIKENVPVVTAASHAALQVIEQIAKEKTAPLTLVESSMWRRIRYTHTGQEFLVHGNFKDYPIRTRLLGEHQGENITVTVAVAERLQMSGVFLSDADIIEGIASTHHIGRLEILSEHPLVLLDGAHNPNGMEKLKKTLMNDFSYSHLILVLGILSDKDYAQMLSTIVPIADTVILTQSTNPRACEPAILKQVIHDGHPKKTVHVQPVLSQALSYAKTIAAPEDLICVTGSLYTVGEARSFLCLSSLKPCIPE